jgi:segregation and condensation protein B
VPCAVIMEGLFSQLTLKQVVEALVFASPKPLALKEVVAALKAAGNPDKTADQTALDFGRTKEDAVEAALLEIQAELAADGRAFRLAEQVNGWSFVTDPAAVHWVRQLYPEAKPTRLTGPQLETLAIIAYRQPVTRADCEAVRGVAVDSVVQVLLERSLIKIAGRADVPGRPLLYETTEYFLQHFGLKHVDELPNSSELKRVVLPTAQPPAEAAPAEPSAETLAEPAAAESTESGPAEQTEQAPEPVSQSEHEPDPEAPSDPEPESEESSGT